MKIRFVALSLLLLVSLGLVLGPHPCHAGGRETAPAEPKASCHDEGMEGMAGPVPGSDGSPDDSGCCGDEHGRRCEMVCQMATGILAAGSSAPLNLPSERLALPPAQHVLRLFVQLIDHVPLA